MPQAEVFQMLNPTRFPIHQRAARKIALRSFPKAVAVAGIFCLMATSSVWAGTLSVSTVFTPQKDKTSGELVATTGTITISDKKYAGQAIKITQEWSDTTTKVITQDGDKVGADGTFKQTSDPAKFRPVYIVHIGDPNAGDTWIVLGGGGKFGRNGLGDSKSLEERKAAEKAKDGNVNFNGTPISVDSSFFYSDASGQQNYVIEFANQSAGTVYTITSLTVYQDLAPQYYNAASFNSPQAIASGTLAYDTGGSLASEGGFLVPNAAYPLPLLDIPILGVRSTGYELIMGTVATIAADGTVGSDVPFSFAQSAVAAGCLTNSRPVTASSNWADTGVFVNVPSTLYGASGLWSWQPSDPTATTDADGTDVSASSNSAGFLADEWIQNYQHGELIGAILPPGVNPNSLPHQRPATLFEVGSDPVSVPSVSGELWLGMNANFVSSPSSGGQSISAALCATPAPSPTPSPSPSPTPTPTPTPTPSPSPTPTPSPSPMPTPTPTPAATRAVSDLAVRDDESQLFRYHVAAGTYLTWLTDGIEAVPRGGSFLTPK